MRQTTEPNFRTFSLQLSPKHKLLAALIVMLVLILVVSIILSLLSVAAIVAIAGAAVGAGAWLAYKIKSLVGSTRDKLSGRKNQEIGYDPDYLHKRRDELDA